MRQRVMAAKMPEHAARSALRESELLSQINPSAGEYSIGLSYIEYLISLPWNSSTEDNLDLVGTEKILNQRHYGLDIVKERVLEHLAVRTLILNRKPRVLVVDDEEIARKNLEHVLLKEDFNVVTASGGAEALRCMEAMTFDVVLTDLRMDKIDGIDVLETICAKWPGTKVIMITGHASIDCAIDAMKRGAFHFITKPFKLDDVRETVGQALMKRGSTLSPKGQVICFAGPPGTGKTSMGRAIAEALGRKFARISLGGIKDEAEIRGHRRTYAGAMPGRIIEEIRRAGSINPVIMLDEVDKIGEDFKGDSSSALLEVLDSEQNRTFIDHYLDIPFDLSGVMFIANANVTDNIRGPLLDRMEVIEFSGYTEDEKLNIGLHYLVPREIVDQGLSGNPPTFEQDGMARIIRDYTREAGIRGLQRRIAAVCRKIAVETVKASNSQVSVVVNTGLIEKYLGPRQYYSESADTVDRIGVSVGLVRTDAGGDIIFIEVAGMKGDKELILTGSLGNIMKESAQTALSYIRSNAAMFGVREDFFDGRDIHIHVPAGAIPKDGPSAGATIAIALISMLTGRPVRRDVAVSGELTLSGVLLPVGGIKEKLLAARRAGVKTVILPYRNRVDVEGLPEDVKNGLDIVLSERIDEVAERALIRTSV